MEILDGIGSIAQRFGTGAVDDLHVGRAGPSETSLVVVVVPYVAASSDYTQVTLN